jgi:hypothetical protein
MKQIVFSYMFSHNKAEITRQHCNLQYLNIVMNRAESHQWCNGYHASLLGKVDLRFEP